MKTILVVSENVILRGFRDLLNWQFSKEIDLKKTELIFTDFESAFGLLEKDTDIGICVVDLSRFDEPVFKETDPQKPMYPAKELLRNIWCKFRHQKIIVGFYQHGYDETLLIKFRHKPEIICPIERICRKIDERYFWIRWDLRGERPSVNLAV